MTKINNQVERSDEIIAQSFRKHKPRKVFGLFSGGHDSLTSTHVLAQHSCFDEVFHANTGIGVEKTREYVRNTCEAFGWPLKEISPADCKDDPNVNYEAKTYEEFVMEYGFPGGAAHHIAYSWLKERPIRKLVRDSKEEDDDNIMLVTGVRKSESTRRMGNVEPIQKRGRKIWVAPITHWTKQDVKQYMNKHDLPRNEVVDVLHMSGECLCGCYGTRSELRWIESFYPEVGERIRELEKQARENDLDYCHWGEDAGFSDNHDPRQQELPMCQDCSVRKQMKKSVDEDKNEKGS